MQRLQETDAFRSEQSRNAGEVSDMIDRSVKLGVTENHSEVQCLHSINARGACAGIDGVAGHAIFLPHR